MEIPKAIKWVHLILDVNLRRWLYLLEMKARQAMSPLAQAGSLGFYPPPFAQLGPVLGAFCPTCLQPPQLHVQTVCF